jgi:site-specific recombinase XerD
MDPLVSPSAAQPLVEGGGSTNPLEAFLATAVDSEHTRRAYRRHILEAFRVMGGLEVGTLRPEGLIHYREVLLADGRGAATHAQALSAVRSFLAWCSDMGGLRFPLRVAERLLRVPKVDVKRPYQTCTRGEADRLLDAAWSLRNRALVLVMLGSGLRVSEVQRLDCSDLVEVDGGPVLWVRRGKGGKDRLVPIEEEVSEAIQRYLADGGRRVGEPGPLFLAEDRGAEARGDLRLSSFGIRYVLQRLMGTAAIAKRLTPHALRHTFGMEFHRNSGDLNKTAKILGHATLIPTLRYTDHLQLAELRRDLPRWRR